jgi:antibiotic biosynthesis monooxygenase (ABM) superfamily enzyme
MLIVVTIDLSMANLAAFDRYEEKALSLLVAMCGTLQRRIQSRDTTTETHILHFANEDSFARFMASPDRAALHPEWLACGAKASLYFADDVDVTKPT